MKPFGFVCTLFHSITGVREAGTLHGDVHGVAYCRQHDKFAWYTQHNHSYDGTSESYELVRDSDTVKKFQRLLQTEGLKQWQKDLLKLGGD